MPTFDPATGTHPRAAPADVTTAIDEDDTARGLYSRQGTPAARQHRNYGLDVRFEAHRGDLLNRNSGQQRSEQNNLGIRRDVEYGRSQTKGPSRCGAYCSARFMTPRFGSCKRCRWTGRQRSRSISTLQSRASRHRWLRSDAILR